MPKWLVRVGDGQWVGDGPNGRVNDRAKADRLSEEDADIFLDVYSTACDCGKPTCGYPVVIPATIEPEFLN